MGLDDEYNVDGVDVEDTEAYREAARAGVTGMGLDEALDLWKEMTTADVEEAYAAALGHTSTLQYDTEALYDFCEDTDLMGEDGIFLSAAIEEAPADTLQLPDLSAVDYVGYRAAKDVTVEGNVRDRCGQELMGGRIVVEGDACEDAGRVMRDGTLTIEGDAQMLCGRGMRDGIITVEGDGGGRIGQYMHGGLIHVKGDAGAYVGFDMNGGEVRVEGEADYNVGRSMQGGTLEVGSTAHPVGRVSSGGDIVVDRKHPDAGGLTGPGWPAPPNDTLSARIFYGTGSSQRQVWPPQSLADWGEHAARALEEVLDDLFGGV